MRDFQERWSPATLCDIEGGLKHPDSFGLAGEAPALQFCMNSIAENLEEVRAQIASAAAKSGRSPDGVELVAITKTHSTEKVREAIEAGQGLFGESRVQEARAKISELPSNVRWHFVGHLQK